MLYTKVRSNELFKRIHLINKPIEKVRSAIYKIERDDTAHSITPLEFQQCKSTCIIELVCTQRALCYFERTAYITPVQIVKTSTYMYISVEDIYIFIEIVHVAKLSKLNQQS